MTDENQKQNPAESDYGSGGARAAVRPPADRCRFVGSALRRTV